MPVIGVMPLSSVIVHAGTATAATPAAVVPMAQ
jgi:hypothetical protein